MRYLLLLAALLIPACAGDGPFVDTSITTPAGYRIGFRDCGSVAAGYDVALLFDQAVEDAAIELAKYGISYDRVVAAVHGYRWSVVDHFRFPTAWSPTGYATGLHIPGFGITLALYTRAYNLDGPPHTHVYWGDKWQSGCIPTALPALLHELEHSFGLIEENHRASGGVRVYAID